MCVCVYSVSMCPHTCTRMYNHVYTQLYTFSQVYKTYKSETRTVSKYIK